MSFPTELPQNALTTLAAIPAGDHVDPGRIALAAYELVGYGLHLYFGDVKYLMGASPKAVEIVNEVIAAFDQNTLDYMKSLPLLEIAEAALAMYQGGTSPYLIAVKLAFKYGPQILPLFKKIMALVEKFRG